MRKRSTLKSLASFANIELVRNTVQVNLVEWFINYFTETVILDSIRNGHSPATSLREVSPADAG